MDRCSCFESMWMELVRKHPLLKEPDRTVTISSDQFRKILHAAYKRGVSDSSHVDDNGFFGDFFEGIFGGKPK